MSLMLTAKTDRSFPVAPSPGHMPHLQIRRSANGRDFDLWPLIFEIQKNHDLNQSIRFGRHEPVLWGDVVYDLSQPERCTSLVQKICECGVKLTQGWQLRTTIPLFLITSLPDRPERYDLQDVFAAADIYFKPCLATGKTGIKTIIPICANGTGRYFQNFKAQGQKIYPVTNLTLHPGAYADVFELVFQGRMMFSGYSLKPPEGIIR
ncbi:MAG: hypothetical protein J0L77_02495 [Alphaproteobacteria bacterium]|nr:hypothetical protein [Alphaproteobacteria bacterium]